MHNNTHSHFKDVTADKFKNKFGKAPKRFKKAIFEKYSRMADLKVGPTCDEIIFDQEAVEPIEHISSEHFPNKKFNFCYSYISN